jgi:antitoxin (DNA-binding transcriptional repressor) of toxin-antitoxin stability system
MLITASELRANIGKYLLLAEKEDIIITKNGKSVAKLSNPNISRLQILDSLVGIVPKETITEGDMRDERLSRQ